MKTVSDGESYQDFPGVATPYVAGQLLGDWIALAESRQGLAVARAGLSARSDSAITSLHMAAAIALESPAATPEGFGSRRNRG
jgi:hypothetical protein